MDSQIVQPEHYREGGRKMYQGNARLKARRAICLAAIVLMPGLGRPAWSQQAPQLGTLTAEKLREMGTTVQLDVNLVRVYPSILQNRQFMRYFIALNNCSNPNIKRTLDNELDYPRVEAYYRSKAAEIVGALPPSVTLAVYGGARSVHDTPLSTDQLRLGDYNPAKGDFPFTFHAAWGSHAAAPTTSSNDNDTNKPKSGNIRLTIPFRKKKDNPPPNDALGDDNTNHVAELEGAFDVHYNRENLLTTCPAANAETGHVFGVLPSQYTINARRMGFDVLPMSEADARKYIDNHGPTDRVVMLAVTLRILDKTPDLGTVPNEPTNVRTVTFGGAEARVSVIDNKTGADLGTLMDDHSLPIDASIMAKSATPSLVPSGTATAPGSGSMNTLPASRVSGGAFPPSASSAANMSMGINAAETAIVESKTCNWPIPEDQRSNAQRFLDEASQSPVWAQRVTAATQIARSRFNLSGVQAFCHSPIRRHEYNNVLTTLWPRGQLAAPANPQ